MRTKGRQTEGRLELLKLKKVKNNKITRHLITQAHKDIRTFLKFTILTNFQTSKILLINIISPNQFKAGNLNLDRSNCYKILHLIRLLL